MFKRMRIELSLVLCLSSALGLLTSWVVTRYIDRSTYHFRIAIPENLLDDLQVLVYDGRLALCNRFDRDSSGEFRPSIWDARKLTAKDLARGDRCRQFTRPGFDLRYYWNAGVPYSIWSLELSLLVPAGLLLMPAAWLRWRLVKVNRQAAEPNLNPEFT